MRINRSLLAITISFSLAMLPSAIAVDKTGSRAAGPTPTTVVNTILSGAGIPSKTLGINGDFYIDTKNLNLYGPKSKGVWKISTSLRANDVPVIANVIGEPGAMGQTGAKGATGATGVRGETGLQGLQGLFTGRHPRLICKAIRVPRQKIGVGKGNLRGWRTPLKTMILS
jgi:hypothetical protein